MTLGAWRSRHHDLAHRLVLARRRLPDADEAGWTAALANLRQALLLHVELEERWLLPAFDALDHHCAPNQRARVVRADHDRICTLLAGLGATDDVTIRAATLGVLADVLDHHDRREAAGLFSALDAHAAEQVPDWLTRFAAAEAALPPLVDARLGGPLRPAPVMPEHPLRATVVAAAHDREVEPWFTRVALPDHPRGPALHAAVGRAVAAAAAAPDTATRRDHLAEVIDRARLLAIVSDPEGPPRCATNPAEVPGRSPT